MPFRSPLTRADLAAIKARRDAADVPALLWEIARLRAIVLRADQLQSMMSNHGGAVGTVLEGLRADLVGEPCVAERGRLKDGEPR